MSVTMYPFPTLTNTEHEREKLLSNLSSSMPTSVDMLRNQLLHQIAAAGDGNLACILQEIAQASHGRPLDAVASTISSRHANPNSPDNMLETSTVLNSRNVINMNNYNQVVDTQNAYASELAKLIGISKADLLLNDRIRQQMENQSCSSQNLVTLANVVPTIPLKSKDSSSNEWGNELVYQQHMERKKESLVTEILSKGPYLFDKLPKAASTPEPPMSQKRKFDLIDYTGVRPGNEESDQSKLFSFYEAPKQNDQKLPASLHGLTGILSRAVEQLIEQQGRSLSNSMGAGVVHPHNRPIVKQSPLTRQELSHLTEASELVCADVCGDVPDSLFVAMAQMKACKLESEDLQGKCKNRVLGSPGINCKHCGGNTGSGRYFPSTLDSFLNGTNAEKIVEHAGYICQKSPPAVRLLIQNLHQWDESHTIRKPYGSRKRFFAYAWSKFNDDPASMKKKSRMST